MTADGSYDHMGHPNHRDGVPLKICERVIGGVARGRSWTVVYEPEICNVDVLSKISIRLPYKGPGNGRALELYLP